MNKSEVIIIGGGVTGLMTAYHLVNRGIIPTIIERGYPGCGATGRCGGGIRQQWSSEENLLLARESVKFWEKFDEEVGGPAHFRQGGYLVLVYKNEEKYKENISFQNSFGVPSRWLSPEEAKEIVPHLSIENLLGATYCPTDGVAYPFSVVHSLEKFLKRNGVKIMRNVEAVDFKHSEGIVTEVVTTQGNLKGENFLIAAGAWSRILTEKLGKILPNKPYRHEILASEPMKFWLKPMVISFDTGIYFSQTYKGEIVGGIGLSEKPGYNMRSSFEFVKKFCSVATRIIPSLKYLRIVRQWAGLYDVTPDAKPILDRLDGFENVYLACGYSGHGFMISPEVGRIMASMICGESVPEYINKLRLKRFEEESYSREENVVG